MYHRTHQPTAKMSSEVTPAQQGEAPAIETAAHPGLLTRTAVSAGSAPDPAAQAERLSRASGGHLHRAGQVLLQLQRDYGNRYVQQVVDHPRAAANPPPVIQPKLVLGPVNDQYEREADRVAQRVVGETAQRPADGVEPGSGSHQPAIQRQALATDGAVEPGVQQAIQQARRGGQPLPDSVRGSMEQAFSADFGNVRLHTDAQADQLNRSLQARAFTTQQDIFFRRGTANPATPSGRKLLAHELTHVVQQDPGRGDRAGSQFAPGAIQRDYAQWESREDQPVLGALGALTTDILAQMSSDAAVINLRDHILSIWEIDRINARISKFSLVGKQGQYLLDLLKANDNAPRKQLLLLKSYAVDRSSQDIETFAKMLADLSDDEAYRMTNLAPKRKGEKGLAQQTRFFCSPTSIQIFRAHFDPMYALQITQDSAQNAGDISKPDPEKNRFAHAEQARISKQYTSDEEGGLEPHERMKAINDLQNMTGVSYCVVDVTEYDLLKNSEGQTTKFPKATDPAILARVTKLVRYALSLGLPTGVGITSHAQIMTDLMQTGEGDDLALYDPKFARTTWTPGALMQEGYAKTGSLQSEVFNVIIPYLENDKAYMTALAQFSADKVILPAKSSWW